MSYEITYSRPTRAEEGEIAPTLRACVSERQLKRIEGIPWIIIHSVRQSKRKPRRLTLS